MDDTVSGLWKRCEKLEAERDELQRKLNELQDAHDNLARQLSVSNDLLEIAVEALQKAYREVASTTGVYSRIRVVDIIEEALKKLEEK